MDKRKIVPHLKSSSVKPLVAQVGEMHALAKRRFEMNATIRITDKTNYQEEKSRNGGAYWFSETAIVEDGFVVDGNYTTSAEIGSMCPYCGMWPNGGGRCCDYAYYHMSQDMQMVVARFNEGHDAEQIRAEFFGTQKIYVEIKE